MSVVMGLFVLVGWVLDIAWIKSVLPGAVEMKANTAVGLLLAGAALWLLDSPPSAWWQRTGQALALAAALLGFATAAEYAFGWRLGIDELLVRDATNAYNPFRGRMSPYSALVFASLGLGLAALPLRPLRWLVWLAANLAVLIGGVSVIGYLWRASELVTDRILPPVAVHTAAVFILLGAGTFAASRQSAERKRHTLASLSSVEARTLAGFLATLMLLLLMGGYAYHAAVESAESARMVAYTQRVRASLGRLEVAIWAAESQHRNYLLSGRPDYLDHYKNHAGEAVRQADALAGTIADNPAQLQRLKQLQSLIHEHLTVFEHTRNTYEQSGLAAAQTLIANGAGQQLMASIHDLVEQMDGVEAGLFQARLGDSAAKQVKTLLSLLATLAVAIAGFMMLYGGIRRELAARTQAEESLRASEENLSVTLHSIGDAVLATDAEGRITRMNGVAEKLTGWTQAEAERRPVAEVFCIINEQTRQPAVIPVEKVLATGTIQGLANHTVIIARDGTERPIADSAAPIRDKDGRVLGVVLVFRDVTEEKQAERAVRESESRYRTLFDSIDEGYCIIEVIFDEQEKPVDYRFLEINPSFEKQTGLRDALGKRMRELAPKHEAHWFEIYGRIALNGEPMRFQNRAEQLGRWYDVFAFRFGDPKNRQVAILFNDITQRKQTEEELIRSEEKLAVTLHSIGDAVLATDAGGRVSRMNNVAERLTGWTQAEAEGRAVAEVFHIINEQTRQPAVIPVDKVLTTGEIHGLANHTVIIARDGTERPIADSASPIRDKAGCILGVVLVFRDVTEEKKAEEEVRRLNAGLEELVAQRTAEVRQAFATLDATVDGAFTFDPASLRFIHVNKGAVRQLGYTREELLTLTPLAIDPKYTETTFRKMIAPLIRGERSVLAYESVHRRKDGGKFPVEINLQYVSPAGAPPRFIAIVRDVTERKKAEQQALRSQRMESIGTLAAGIAHDLNNALAPILMSSGILRSQYPKETTALDMIESSTKRAADMVRQLLTFAKGAEGERIPLPPARLIKDMHKIMDGSFPKNVRVVVKCAPELPLVLGDATQLHQVLLNLCVNARDAMANGGVLTLEADSRVMDTTYASSIPDAKPGKYVLLRVSDTGTGIPPEIVDRIFDPFFTTKGPDKGTGLGLSTVLGIVKGHGGFLHVYSQPGQGSIFTIYLPVGNAGGDIAFAARPALTFRGQGEVVLFVDDEPELRAAARTVLQRLNFRPLIATDGADGLMQVAQYPAELRAVITDLHMPHMDGLAFVRALRRMLPAIPVVVASGRMEDNVAEEFKALRVTDLLDKPFTEAQLAEVLKTVLMLK